MALGVVSRFADHLQHFTPAYYEVKGVTGVWHNALPYAIPMISVFGDNRLSKAHPEWVQIGPDGERATRASRYFDWDAICPSHDATFDQGLNWVAEAVRQSGSGTVRLDDVTYAREGFCQCQTCQTKSQDAGMTLNAFRIQRLVDFVRQAHLIAPHLHMTLFPDPFPGHLQRRFGVDPDRLAHDVEAFVVPIYDLHYATTYWLEILAEAFLELIPGRYYIELYGLQVPEEALLHACQVAQAYCDGVIVAYENHLPKLQRIEERLALDS